MHSWNAQQPFNSCARCQPEPVGRKLAPVSWLMMQIQAVPASGSGVMPGSIVQAQGANVGSEFREPLAFANGGPPPSGILVEHPCD